MVLGDRNFAPMKGNLAFKEEANSGSWLGTLFKVKQPSMPSSLWSGRTSQRGRKLHKPVPEKNLPALWLFFQKTPDSPLTISCCLKTLQLSE
jgi:hypothetical protein